MKLTCFRDLTSCRLIDRCKCCRGTKSIYDVIETGEDKRNMFRRFEKNSCNTEEEEEEKKKKLFLFTENRVHCCA